MADQIITPHPHIDMRGGFVRIVDEEATYINALLHGLKDNDKFVFDFDGLVHRCNRAESALNGLGIPDDYWNGITFYAYSRGPGKRYPFDTVVGLGVKVQRQRDEWVLLDAYKTPISKTETAEPRFNQFTTEQWNQATDFSDSPYRRRPEVKFTVTK